MWNLLHNTTRKIKGGLENEKKAQFTWHTGNSFAGSQYSTPRGCRMVTRTIGDHRTETTAKVVGTPTPDAAYERYFTPPEENKKAVVLLSGGLDSTVLMYSLVNDYVVFPLTVAYGQKHNKEVIAARNVCEARDHNLLLRWKYVDLSILRALLPSALTGKGEIPQGHYENESMKQTVVPNRNMILLAIAAGYANGLGATHVAYAAHQNDRAIYPDCRPEFIKSVGETLRLGTGGTVELLEPFVDMTKVEIVRLGRQLNVPFRLCWSCYSGGERPCLRCGTCTERTEAFQLAGFPDPLLTGSEWLEAQTFLNNLGVEA